MKRWMGMALIVLLVVGSRALGIGVLVPKDEKVPPLATKYLRVDATIENQMAKTVVEQVFQNSTNRDLEARYIFPLPAGASVRDFAMWMNGKRTSGEIVEKGKARQVYQSIVRRMRDPGLLEYLGNNLFRANVYPVPKKGTVKIQIEYGQVVPMEDGLARYTFPLRTGEKASRTLEDFSVTVRLESKVPLKSIYSPTHKVGIKRRDDHHATIGMEVDKAVLNRDFTLYYAVSRKDFGLNLITHRLKGEPGYFLLLIAPRTEVEEAKVARKDVCFVLDVSGSMSGPKIEQARKALRYCIRRLRKRDRFSLIAFSIETDALSKALLPATDANKKKAIAFIDGLEAQGGTDINAALTEALALKPGTVIFLTDGKPTVGETDTKRIVANVKKHKGGARVFVFGVDERVNTHLLDRISEVSGGTREYVTPSEDIEVKVTGFFNKASSPVLSHVSVDLPGIKTADVYPRAMGDLFKGQQVLVVGRYKTAGSSAIVLRGDIEGEKRSFTYEGEFPAEATGSAFVEGLWARRKVGYLLDQIRLHGENDELKKEVIRLSRKHTIITPYTSYLVLEGTDDYKKHGIVLYDKLNRLAAAKPRRDADADRPGDGGAHSGGSTGRPASASQPEAPKTVDELLTRRGRDEKRLRELERHMWAGRKDAPSPSKTPADPSVEPGVPTMGDIPVLGRLFKARTRYKLESGAEAMELSRELQALKRADVAGAAIRGGKRRVTVRKVARRTMVLYQGFWIDVDWTEKLERVSIKYAGDAYFKLLAAEPKLKDVFKLGTRLIVVLPSKVALVIQDDGKDTLSEQEIKRLLTPAKAAAPEKPAQPEKPEK